MLFGHNLKYHRFFDALETGHVLNLSNRMVLVSILNESHFINKLILDTDYP
jgi:hypothetical protein